MRAEQLTVQAFGCYLRETRVDFSALNGNIFLITGSTGGGKTTLLDGICFALYCRATGGRRSWSDMRSISAPQSVPTVVDFSFSLGRERYRFRRSLKIHQVRGSGRLEQRDEHACWQWKNGDWSLLVSGAESKVREKAQELLGLTCEQFSQVVVLPQGEFRKLLLSNSTEKARIFQTLFQTERWERIAKAAQNSAEESKQRLEQLFHNRELLLKQEDCSDLLQLKEKEQDLYRQAEQAEKLRNNLEQRLARANQEYSDFSVLHELYQQLDQFTEESRKLSQNKALAEEMQAKWEKAKNIRELLPEYRNYRQALCEKEETGRRLEQASLQKKQAEQRLGKAREQARKIDSLRKDWEQCTQALALLERGKPHAENLLKIQQELCQRKKEKKEKEGQCIQYREKKEEASEKIKKGELFVRQISEQARALPQKMEQLSRLGEMESNFTRLEEKQKEYHLAQKQWEQAVQEEKSARVQSAALQNQFMQIEEQFARHTAVQLASSLEEGKPCPVCGSLEHPHPAHMALDIPQEEQRKFLRQAVQESEEIAKQKAQQMAAASALLQVKKQEMETLEDTCRGYPIDRSQLAAQLEEVKRQAAECQKAQQQLPLAEKRLEQRRQEQQGAQKEEENLREKVHQYDNRIAELQSAYQMAIANLPQGIQTAQQLEERYQIQARKQKTLQESIRLLEEQTAQAEKSLAQAQEQRNILAQRFQEQQEKERQLSQQYGRNCEKRAVHPQDPLEELWIGEEEFTLLEQQIRQYRERVHLVTERLSELQKKVADTKRPDMQAIQEELAALRQQAGKASQQAGALTQAWGQLSHTLQTLQQEEEKSRGLEQQWAQRAKIAQLLSGNNKKKVPIKMFVLGIMLDDILGRANLYFSTFSEGRYRLTRPDLKTGGRGYGGLELVIFDGYSGGTRPVETLSGGELFLASLSLAFGLSDVVQGNSGGVRLDSIFIDEGFGSLDQETLDTAMWALDEIQRSGRTVGIISHVQELKSRIPAKIEVIPLGDGGSTARVRI